MNRDVGSVASRPSRQRILRTFTILLPAALMLGSVDPIAGQSDVQQEIRDSQRRLEEIQSERRDLQTQLNNLRSRARNVSAELQNIERQLSASRSVMDEIDFQVEAASSQVTRTTTELARSRSQLGARSKALDARLRGIYKRGPLSSTRVLLGADSFADLINRYRTLHTLASIDRGLVDGVRRLEQALVDQNEALGEQLSELQRLRESKSDEMVELRRIEQTRQGALRSFRSLEARTAGRLSILDEQESRLAGLVTDLERRRIAAEQRRRIAGEPETAEVNTLTSADVGALDWPVSGEVIYSFGRQRDANGIMLRWNGVGIRAPVGTPVTAVRAGTVLQAGPFEGYGPSIVLSHGGGMYTLYLYLDRVTVNEGRRVSQGQVIGAVGGAQTPEGPHLEFQVRITLGGGTPQAVDPTQWLKPPGS